MKEKREVEFSIMPSVRVDNDDSPTECMKAKGYVELHLHEIDGSQTILIRTKRRESVEEFINNELSGK